MTKRKPYRKPGVKQIKLVPKEAVLTFCKVSNTDGPGGAGCKVSGSACANSAQGS